MAEGGRRQKRSTKKEEESGGLGTLLAVGAVAAGVGALVYGAKKLYDAINSETEQECGKKLPDDYDEEYYRPAPPPPSQPTRHERWNTAGSSTPLTHTETSADNTGTLPKTKTPARNLSDQLHTYYRDYVAIPSGHLVQAQKVVTDIKDAVSKYVRQNNSSVGCCSLNNFGSSREDLQVVAAESFDLMLPIELSSELWQLVQAAESGVFPSSGFYCLQRVNTERHPLGSHPYDEHLDTKSFLNTQEVLKALDVLSHGAVDGITEYTISVQPGPSIHVTYQAADSCHQLCVTVFPAVILQGVLVMPKDCFSPATATKYPTLWQKSFSAQEADNLKMFDPSSACHLQCLKIMKAVRLNHTTVFGAFPSYIFKTILLHMMAETPEEDLWQSACLQEQFVDMLNQVLYYLQGGRLPNFFDSSINLLDDVLPEDCERLVRFIISHIGKEKLHTLLEQNYSLKPSDDGSLI